MTSRAIYPTTPLSPRLSPQRPSLSWLSRSSSFFPGSLSGGSCVFFFFSRSVSFSFSRARSLDSEAGRRREKDSYRRAGQLLVQQVFQARRNPSLSLSRLFDTRIVFWFSHLFFIFFCFIIISFFCLLPVSFYPSDHCALSILDSFT